MKNLRNAAKKQRNDIYTWRQVLSLEGLAMIMSRLSLTKAEHRHTVDIVGAVSAPVTDWQVVNRTFLEVMEAVAVPASPNSWCCGALP